MPGAPSAGRWRLREGGWGWMEDRGVACHFYGDGIVWLGWAGLPLGPASPVGSFRALGPAVLINQSQPFISSPHFLFTLWGRRVTSRAAATAGRPAVPVANCHQHCLRSLTGWTHDGHLNGRRRSAPPAAAPQRNHRHSRRRPPPALSLCFDSFICKSRDKTYGANLQQINGDPGWLSTLDIRRERCDTPSTCLCLKLCLIH